MVLLMALLMVLLMVSLSGRVVFGFDVSGSLARLIILPKFISSMDKCRSTNMSTIAVVFNFLVDSSYFSCNFAILHQYTIIIVVQRIVYGYRPPVPASYRTTTTDYGLQNNHSLICQPRFVSKELSFTPLISRR